MAPSSNLMTEVSDGTYSALAYAPRTPREVPPPLLVVLHGAGINKLPVWNLADPMGEHAGLPPSLLAAGRAPAELADNFAVIAPYSFGKASFYDEPRRKLLSFIDWATSDAGRLAGCPAVDPARVFLLGFSDGATVGVELLTTGRFRGGIVAAYGFTGTLPPLAAERLRNVPLWVFHSADDVIFDVANGDRLVRTVREAGNERVRYTRFECDQEGFTGRVRGHSTGITASKDPAVYEWLLSL
jgi:predicted peptidase